MAHPGIKRSAAHHAHLAAGLKSGHRIISDGVISASGGKQHQHAQEAARSSHEEFILVGKSFPNILDFVPGFLIGGQFGQSLMVISRFWKILGVCPQSPSRMPLTTRANWKFFFQNAQRCEDRSLKKNELLSICIKRSIRS